MSESAIMILLRLIHIISGALWVGAVFLLAVFVVPSMRASGPAGGRLLQEMGKRRIAVFMASMPGLVLLSGIGMFYIASRNTGGAFPRSAMGTAISIGAALAIVAGIVGGAVTGRTVAALDTLLTAIDVMGNPPSADQSREILRLQGRLGASSRTVAALLLLATAAMAMARYL